MRGHTVPAKQTADDGTYRIIAKRERSVAALNGRSSEQPAVQEGNASERAGRSGSPPERSIQRPEEERIEKPAMH